MRSLTFFTLALCTVSALAAPLVKETIATGLMDPMEIAIAPSGDFYVAEREGRVLRVNPTTGGVFEIGIIAVQTVRSDDPKNMYGREDALHGIALDPDFSKNQRIYLYYSAADAIMNRLSRFTLKEGKIDFSSELKLIEIPTNREPRVCHHGGSLKFGPDGLLYLSTGDNTNPFDSKGCAPIDDRDNREPWDARRSAGNTNDLRGKILRIQPTETGYEIPNGNLFPKGTEKTRPEIYVMGCRNPFRISIDPKTQTLYWGEVGPDADHDGPEGPRGHDEINQAKAAGNFGWPFVIANNQPYPIRNFADQSIGKMTDPAAPENSSQRNTGLKVLPPAQPAFIWYPYAKSDEFPNLGQGGRNAMAGPVFYYESNRPYNVLTQAENRTLIHYDWIRGKLFKSQLDRQEKFEKMEVMMENLVHPMDLEMAQDGSLVLLEYGTDWYFNKNGSIHRIIPDTGNQPPTITIKATEGVENSYSVDRVDDPDGGKITVTWYLTEGATERKLGTDSHIVVPPGAFQEIRAVAEDDKGAKTVARISLVAAKEVETLTLELEKAQTSVGFGERLKFKVRAKTELNPKQLKVRARYISPTGHDAGGPQFEPVAAELAKVNLCFACHQVDAPSVGPAYFDVSLKYRDQKDATEILKHKVKTGGAGVWGEIPMPPQVALKPDDADQLIATILALSNGNSQITGTLDGEIQLPAQQNLEPGGTWEVSAEAPGYTPFRTRIPAK